MAKITRTITSMKVLVLCADSEKGELTESYFTFGQALTDKKIQKEIEKQLKESNFVFVKIKEKELVTEKYAISVEDFMAHAQKVEDK